MTRPFVTSLPLDRRRFLAAGAALAVAGNLPRRVWGADAAPTADLLIPGKNKRLIVHSATPLEIETPLDLLRSENVTPVESLFVRNNQQPDFPMNLEPLQPEAWKLEIIGRLEFPKTIELRDLAKLPQTEVEMVLQCSGNGRAYFSEAAPAKGSQWKDGAVANVKFRGVPLRALFEHLEVQPDASAKFVTAEGQEAPDKPGAADFEHSLPLGDVLDRSLLALELNGRPLPAVHGGPLRLVTPGYYGTMHVKWLSRLRLEEQETVNHHQVKRYRTPLKPIEPGSAFDYNLDNSEPNWGMRIKSCWFTPLEGEKLKPGRNTLGGVAWNDGRARIDAVEVSQDGGKSWRGAELQRSESLFAWQRFQIEANLAPGEQTWLCRAVDTLGRTQPLDGAIGWNPAGYGWNGVQAVTFNVE